MTTAREIMTPTAEFARRDETIENAARRMLDRDVGALSVCNADRQIDGVVTDRDITVKVVTLGLDPATNVPESKTGDLVESISEAP